MEHFDLVVVGSGSGDTVVDQRFADLDVAIIERTPNCGGTSLTTAIPATMFAAAADYASSPTDAARLGVELEVRGAYYDRIRDRVFSRVDPLRLARLEQRHRATNVTVLTGTASFVAPRRLAVGSQLIEADRIVLACGSRPAFPVIDGLNDPAVASRVHSCETIMRLDQRPDSLVIIGGGPVAVEFAHVFAGLGTRVTLLNRSDRLLRHADADIATRFTTQLARRVAVRLNQSPCGIEPLIEGVSVIAVDAWGIEYRYDADVVLVAVGRVSNSDTVNPDAGGVRVDDRGLVVVDSQQCTTAEGVWALGDVCSPGQPAHVTASQARTVAHNLLVDITGQGTLIDTDRRVVPHAIFTNPQIAAVGATEVELVASKRRYSVHTRDYSTVPYGWALEDTAHFVKLLTDPDTKHLLGAHIIGPQAATLLQPLVTAMSFGIDATTMARGQYWIHPALTEVIEAALLEVEHSEA